MEQKKIDFQFSVSMSVYKNDHPEHFKEAIESVYNQTLLPTEVVLVVDGPVNQEIALVISVFEKKYDNFKVIWLQENLGHAGARRTGLENCSYDIVALMDSDDLSERDRFEKQIQALQEDNSISAIGGQIEEFDDHKDLVVGNRIVPLVDADIKDYMKRRCPMNQVSVMIKKTDILEVGGYIDWHNNEDYFLWIRMALAGLKFKNIKDVLVKVRVNDEMYKRRGGWLYFNSERKIQMLMYNHNLIKIPRLVYNVLIRFIIQVVIPNNLRKFLFTKLFRN